MLRNNKKTSFAHYKEGYVDGYDGNLLKKPENDNYVRGYEEGKEDDQHGTPGKKCFLPEDSGSMGR